MIAPAHNAALCKSFTRLPLCVHYRLAAIGCCSLPLLSTSPLSLSASLPSSPLLPVFGPGLTSQLLWFVVLVIAAASDGLENDSPPPTLTLPVCALTCYICYPASRRALVVYAWVSSLSLRLLYGSRIYARHGRVWKYEENVEAGYRRWHVTQILPFILSIA